MGGAGFKSCCNEPTPYLCFQSAAAGGGGGGAGGGNQLITSAPPPSITDPQQIACQTAVDIVQACESAVPGFDNLDDSEIASCLCYSGSVWQPQSFDQPWSSCINWASTADASDLAVWTTLRGFCSRVGDVVNAPASAAATTTQASSPNSAPATATGPVLQSEATTTTTKAAGASQGASTGDSTGARTTSSSTSASSSGASSKSGARMLANPKELLPQVMLLLISASYNIWLKCVNASLKDAHNIRYIYLGRSPDALSSLGGCDIIENGRPSAVKEDKV